MSSICEHCGGPLTADQKRFCCSGCEAAYAIIHDLGLDKWYERRILQTGVRAPKPEDNSLPFDAVSFVREVDAETCEINLLVEGLHCAACVWLIENVLARETGVVQARLNMTTRRLRIRWEKDVTDAVTLIAAVNRLGYRLVPYDPAVLAAVDDKADKDLLKALAVAGFAAGNVMLLSISVWAGAFSDMNAVTRDFLHWISALIALPAIAYAGRPFFLSATAALRAERLNMDVPISLAVVVAAAMSLFETATGGEHVYFDASVTLLFFLLIGRYLDRRARSRARSVAEHLLGLTAKAATVIAEDGTPAAVPLGSVKPGMLVAVAAGERVPVDGTVASGQSDVDVSLVTGESIPEPVAVGGQVFAGTSNLTGALRVRVTAASDDTLLAEIVRLMEAAEQGRAKYVVLADRVARLYAPGVHALGLLTFVGWMLAGLAWQDALLIAVAVLIVTCPCALGLAVPAVQAVATGRLFRKGILVKSADALERLNDVDVVVFDKTGTLTMGQPQLEAANTNDSDLSIAASIAATSRHPLSRALARSVSSAPVMANVRELPGEGLEAVIDGNTVRLGRRQWCGIEGEPEKDSQGPELWLSGQGRAPRRFGFVEDLRPDAANTVVALVARGLDVVLLSGDRETVVRHTADAVGIVDWHANLRPDEKVQYLEHLRSQGRKPLMVGDGLNDAPALAAASVSASPSAASDVTQTAADLVFQGDSLDAIVAALDVASRSDRLVKQNLGLAFAYNLVAVPAAMAGLVTPLIAAAAMSLSSLAVTLNALRLGIPTR